MWCRLNKVLSLSAVLIGLCTSVHANTTASPSPLPQLAQTDLAVPPFSPVPDIVPAEPPPPPPPAPAPARIALLLPLRSATLSQAADAVRAGFLAAYERDRDGVAIDVVETGDAEQDVVPSYTAAAEQHDIVVGPLSRSDVTAVAQSGAVNKPTIALTPVDSADEAGFKLPGQMLTVGLSIEDEARQVATWAKSNKKNGKAFVLATGTAWQVRAAKAFAAQWQKLGGEMEAFEMAAFNGYLSARSLADLKRLVETDEPALLFAALDARQGRQLRIAVGNQVPLYGTSQLNPFTQGNGGDTERSMELNGARLLDIPWQLQPDHPAVMVYPRPVVSVDQKRSADLERLYALGIDAYRVAREIAFKRSNFELDGVTGKLTVRFDNAGSSFARAEQRAIYQDGSVTAVLNKR